MTPIRKEKTMVEVVEEGHELRWHIGANLRWLANQDSRPPHMPCGELTGAFLMKVADRLEELSRPSSLSVGEEDVRAIDMALQMIGDEDDPETGSGVHVSLTPHGWTMIIDALKRSKAAISAMSGGGE